MNHDYCHICPQAKAFLALSMLCAIIPGCSRDNWSADAVEATKARGNEIVEAVLKYKLEHGNFPAVLEEIVPKYLARIEPPLVGTEEWSYVPHAGSDMFVLQVRGESIHRPTLYYSSRDKGWHLDTK